MDNKHVESDCLPLCFSSFEWLKKRHKVSDQKQKFEIMDEGIKFLGMDDKKEEQLCNQSRPIEKLAICSKKLNNEEEDESSQMDVPFCFSNSEILC